jgi:hypothetical protein
MIFEKIDVNDFEPKIKRLYNCPIYIRLDAGIYTARIAHYIPIEMPSDKSEDVWDDEHFYWPTSEGRATKRETAILIARAKALNFGDCWFDVEVNWECKCHRLLNKSITVCDNCGRTKS